MSRSFRCSIVKPTGSVFDEQVRYVSLPAWDGQVGVMCNASPMLTRLGAGVLRIDTESGASRYYMIDGGFAQMQNNVLTLLADAAFAAEELTMQEAEAELAEANARVTRAGQDQERVRHDQMAALAKKATIETAR